jgi:hypothetical protein
MAGLLGTPYSMNQASYDLAPAAPHGLITRVPGHNRYTLTPDGIGFAIFYTKVHDRVLRPLLATRSQPHAPPELRAPRSTPSSTRSTNASPTPGYAPQPNRHLQTHDNRRNRSTEGSLACQRSSGSPGGRTTLTACPGAGWPAAPNFATCGVQRAGNPQVGMAV